MPRLTITGASYPVIEAIAPDPQCPQSPLPLASTAPCSIRAARIGTHVARQLCTDDPSADGRKMSADGPLTLQDSP